ncbi:hypothetical protein NOC27_878 [Nitrosococcus oceani AFC27]|nr:hypothetical protein NOC27_878 [Nitrosococcus oceani AFC27]
MFRHELALLFFRSRSLGWGAPQVKARGAVKPQGRGHASVEDC